MSSSAVTLPSQPISFSLVEDESTSELVSQEIGGNVTMSRALAESAHGLTLNESRVMMLAMRCINPRFSPYQYAKANEYVKVRVTAAEFGKLANLLPDANGYTNRAAYDGLKAACDKLYERSITWKEGKRLRKSCCL